MVSVEFWDFDFEMGFETVFSWFWVFCWKL